MDIRDRFRVPPEFPALLKLWTTEVLRAQPANIPQFSADFFDALLMSGMERKMNSFGTGSGSEFYAADSLYSAARELENQQAHQAQYGLNASMMSSSSASTSSSSTAQAIASAPARDPRSMILLDRIPDFFPARVHPITVYTLCMFMSLPSRPVCLNTILACFGFALLIAQLCFYAASSTRSPLNCLPFSPVSSVSSVSSSITA